MNNHSTLHDDPFVAFLRSRADATVYLKPYWGNSGDTLISLGCREVLAREGLKLSMNPERSDLILWPGGNPTMWKGNLDEWSRCWEKWPDKEFVVGPATFQGLELPWQSMLEQCGANIGGLFARDPVSHENLLKLKLPKRIRVGLSHDPAFMLKDSLWLKELLPSCSGEFALAAFRSDHEGIRPFKHRLLQRAPWPLSSLHRRIRHKKDRNRIEGLMNRVRALSGGMPILCEDVALRSFDSFVEKVSQASVVHTDRLHTMILGVLLGKEVIAYPTAYSKLEQVYDHSISTCQFVKFESRKAY
jgi:hypothetical protein